jgi:DNA-binding transcriptional LysR family regulator
MTKLEIEAFLTVIKTGSITAAAKYLFVTQPALSRRILALESELGYSLIVRKKGVRTIELTNQGKAFISVAEKWQVVWLEAQEITNLGKSKMFYVSSIGSVSSYILPSVFRRFMKDHPDCRLVLYNHHSREAYSYIESRQIDLALISDNQFSRTTETVPAFREKMILATNGLSELKEKVHPSMLEVKREIRLPWNPEYDLWHNYWFGSNAGSKVILDQMSLLEDFLNENNTWAVIPATVAYHLIKNTDVTLHELLDPPPDRIIYYLIPMNQKNGYVESFLHELNYVLQDRELVESFL